MTILVQSLSVRHRFEVPGRSMMFAGIGIQAGILAVAAHMASAADVDLKFSDLQAGYIQNAQALLPFAVTVRVTQSKPDVHFDVLTKRIAYFEAALARMDPAHRDGVKRQLEQFQAELQQRDPTVATADILCGKQDLLVVVPSEGIPAATNLATADDLARRFARPNVLSWSERQSPPGWMWQGRSGDGHLYAKLTTARPLQTQSFPVVPVGEPLRYAFQGSRLISPFDAFFSPQDAHTTIIGRESLNGKSVVVVEHSYKKAVPALVRGYLSLDHGCFPLRIESFVRTVLTTPHELVQVESINSVGKGAFYPDRWTIEHRADDDRDPAMRDPNRRTGFVHYIRCIEEWDVEVQSGIAEPIRLSQTGFPVGTICFNEDEQAYFTSGSPDQAIQSMLDIEAVSPPRSVATPAEPPRPNPWRGVVIALNLLLVPLIVWQVVRHRRAAQGKP